MKLSDRLRAREKKLTVKKRLTYSNIIMFLVPVAVTVLTAFIALAVAFYAFSRFCLPRMGLSMRELHDMGEQYENDLKTFGMLLLVLALVMLALLILSIVLTNLFLIRKITATSAPYGAPATGSARKPHIPKTLKNRQTRKFSSALPRQQ